MISKHKVNDFENRRVNIGKEKKIMNEKYIPSPYGTLYINAKTGNGKTNLIYNILGNMCYADDEVATDIIIVSSTANIDPVMIKLVKDFEKFYDVQVYDELGNAKDFTELMEGIIEQIQMNEEHPKYKFPSTILIMDDVKAYLRLPIVKFLLTKVRHFKTFLIIAGHSYVDIDPEARENLHYLVVFKKLAKKRLEAIHNEFISSFDFNTFYDIYQDATKDEPDSKHNFLFIDVNREKLRKNLNEEYEVPS